MYFTTYKWQGHRVRIAWASAKSLFLLSIIKNGIKKVLSAIKSDRFRLYIFFSAVAVSYEFVLLDKTSNAPVEITLCILMD